MDKPIGSLVAGRKLYYSLTSTTHRDINLSVCDALDVVRIVRADVMEGHSKSLESITATA